MSIFTEISENIKEETGFPSWVAFFALYSAEAALVRGMKAVSIKSPSPFGLAELPPDKWNVCLAFQNKRDVHLFVELDPKQLEINYDGRKVGKVMSSAGFRMFGDGRDELCISDPLAALMGIFGHINR
jgi:hypothetical protein